MPKPKLFRCRKARLTGGWKLIQTTVPSVCHVSEPVRQELQDNPDAPQLFREDACLQCGICVATCPEKVISLAPQFNLSDKAMATELVIEDEPFHCTSCGKPFGTTKSIGSEDVIA